jgi:mRNA interferase MazF
MLMMIQVEKEKERMIFMIDGRLIKRGDIVYIDIPEDKNDPHKQTGVRPCVITTNDGNNRYCNRVDYVPLTSQIKKPDLPPHAKLYNTKCLQKTSMALCEQWGSVDKSFVKEKIGTVSEEDMFKIELAMLKQQGINIFLLVKNMKQYSYA